MYAFIDAAIARSRTTMLIMFMVVLAGLIARSVIPVANEPDIDIPFFIITVVHEGIAPEDAERLLVLPLEIEMRNVEGIEEMTSFASEGAATLMVEFDADHDLNKALIDTREAVDRAKAEFPSTAEEPIVQEASIEDFPILQINIVGDVPERMLYNIALDLREVIETIPDVLDADMFGHREELLEAIIDPNQLEAYEISSEQLINTIVRNNRLIPAGSLDTGEGRFAVKIPSIIEQASDVFQLPVRTEGDTVVTLGDVATVRRTFKDRTNYARVNGRHTISLQIVKRADANILSTIAATKAKVDEYRPRLPGRVDVFYTTDQAPFAQSQVTELQGNIFTALGLVMIVVVAAMGFRSGVIVGLSIPVSFLFALIFIYLLGYTFNFMVMFGMLLGLGMLIDGAIVVTEYADRKMTEGYSARPAYTLAARRMFWPVVASTATTLAAFLPLMFWPGISGKFMRYLPVTVFTVLSGSLLYALVFGPVLGSLFGKAGTRDKKAQVTLKQLEEGDPTTMKSLTGWYARLLSVASRYAVVTLALALAVVISTFWAYGQYGKGVIFFSDSEPKYANISIRARGNLSVEEVNELVKEVEDEILEVGGISSLNTTTLLTGRPSRSGSMDRIGQMFLELHDENLLTKSGTEILEEIRQKTSNFAGVTVEIEKIENGPSTGKALFLQFSSHNKALLEPAVTRVVEHMKYEMEGLRDIDDTRSLPGVEWKLSVDKAQAAIYGADVSQVGIAVQLITNGVKVGEYRPDRSDDGVDIRVRYPTDSRGISALDELRVATPKGLIPISNFVTREPTANVDTIQRINGVPIEQIRANVAPDVLADDKVQELQNWIDQQTWHPDLTIIFRGANEEQTETMQFVLGAFGLSLLLMFVLLVTQFNSFYQSFLILFAVVLSTAGVFLGLLITNNSFSAILTGVGIVALAGIVVNNNIVLIDTYNHIRREHPNLDYIQLIVRTGAQRLRPVMLTTITTVFGLLPLASNLSIDLLNRTISYGGQLSSFWVPLSQAIVSGLTFSTLLTLVTTPAMLALPHQIKHLWQRYKPKSQKDARQEMSTSPTSAG
ncbi:MAG: efflux RND transporter permease subunit [Gammaproteobacteria bacterium]|nr:efflux RND transporter permease subunit [Gammaproteobacteria bacterium]